VHASDVCTIHLRTGTGICNCGTESGLGSGLRRKEAL
jgi:hypothetical protein